MAVAARECVALLRDGKGPLVLECSTQRVRGHYEGDPQKYRPAEELAAMEANDPIARSERALLARGVKPAAIHKLREEVDAQVARAIDAARADPEPVFADAFADVYAGAGRR